MTSTDCRTQAKPWPYRDVRSTAKHVSVPKVRSDYWLRYSLAAIIDYNFQIIPGLKPASAQRRVRNMASRGHYTSNMRGYKRLPTVGLYTCSRYPFDAAAFSDSGSINETPAFAHQHCPWCQVGNSLGRTHLGCMHSPPKRPRLAATIRIHS